MRKKEKKSNVRQLCAVIGSTVSWKGKENNRVSGNYNLTKKILVPIHQKIPSPQQKRWWLNKEYLT